MGYLFWKMRLSPAPWLWGGAAGLLALCAIWAFRAYTVFLLNFAPSFWCGKGKQYYCFTINDKFNSEAVYKRAALALFLCAIAAFGCFMGARAQSVAAAFPAAPGQEASLLGQARGNSVYRGDGRYRLLLAVNEVNGAPWRGQVYLYYEGGPLLAGDMVAARGSVLRFTPYGNPGAFNYDAYMKRQGVAAALSCYYGGEAHSLRGFADPGHTIRERLLQAMEEAAGDASALLKGVFLGDKSELSFSQKSALSLAGVLHAFAVSGLHVGYLVAAALLLAGSGRRRRWQRLILTAALLLFYLHLTGLPASIVRASLMALTLLTATALDEKNDPLTTISLAALVCLLYRPLWLFDAGFQLSFAAAGGIFYLLPTMRMLLAGPHGLFGSPPATAGVDSADVLPLSERINARIRESFAVTLAASFGVMPLIGYYFYHISIVGWLVSPLFVIGAGLTVLLCFAAALAAIFSVSLAQLPLFVADLIMRPLMALSSFSSSLPGAYIASGQTPLAAVAIFYAALLALPRLSKKRRRSRRFIALSLITLVLLLSLAPGLWRLTDRRLEVVFIDVGQGDAALIITPQGQSILIDGGGDRLASGKVGENALLPYLRYRGLNRIDLIISSHPDADHIDGLFTVVENLAVGQLLYADVFPESALQERLLKLAQARGIEQNAAYAGQRFALGSELTLTVLNPPAGANYSERDNNAGCLSFLLSYGETDFLFTGDASFSDLVSLQPARIVKLPHHGSKGAYDEDAYALLSAEAVVISVGRDNNYGHPGANVVEYWQERSALFRTDLQGAVTIKSDGRRWQAYTYWQPD